MPSERTLRLLDQYAALKVQAARYDRSMSRFEKGRSMYYDRESEPITFGVWAVLAEIRDYRHVAFDEVGPYHVSTIWLGLDHNFTGGVPIIFESMVFSSELSISTPCEAFEVELDGKSIPFPAIPAFAYHESHEQWRYSTEAQALKGHEILCDQVRLTVEALGDLDPRDWPAHTDSGTD